MPVDGPTSGGRLGGAIEALMTAAVKSQEDTRRRALLELARACAEFERAPTAGDADEILARAQILAETAAFAGDRDAAAAAELVAARLTGAGEPGSPAAVANGATGAAGAETRESPGSAAGEVSAAPLVLVVDDDPDIRNLIVIRLRSAGFRVQAEDDGTAGMMRARAEQPALVICDLGMPIMPGELLILGLRSHPDTASIPICVVSADPTRLGPEHRVDAVLAKPIEAGELIAIARRLTASSRRQDAPPSP